MPSLIRAPNSGPGAPPYASTRRVSFSELLGGGTFFNGRVIEGRDRE